jgi:glycosyltransferase involved in cell wall biosynthesis
MRVCILTTSFPLYKGITIGTHVLEQARHLADLGVQVDVLAPHHKGAPWHDMVNGVSVYRFRYMWPSQWQTLCYGAGIPTNLKKSMWAKIQLPFLMLSLFFHTLRIARRSDCIHAHWSLCGLAGIVAGRLLNKPVAVMLHHGSTSHRGDPLTQFVARKSSILLCNSSYTLSKISATDRLGRCKVISPGVDIARFEPQKDTRIFFSCEPDIPKNRPFILALGRLIGWKGFAYLIDAMALVHTDPLPYLLIGGRGPLRKQLERRIQQKRLEDRIKLVGNIPYEYIHHYHSAADIFILPSIIDQEGNTEGLGVVLLEALACGTPCIASNVGGIPDIIKDGKNGFLVEPKDVSALAKKITALIENEGLRQEMSDYGRRFVAKEFSWQAKARELYTTYQKLAAKK